MLRRTKKNKKTTVMEQWGSGHRGCRWNIVGIHIGLRCSSREYRAGLEVAFAPRCEGGSLFGTPAVAKPHCGEHSKTDARCFWRQRMDASNAKRSWQLGKRSIANQAASGPASYNPDRFLTEPQWKPDAGLTVCERGTGIPGFDTQWLWLRLKSAVHDGRSRIRGVWASPAQ